MPTTKNGDYLNDRNNCPAAHFDHIEYLCKRIITHYNLLNT